MKSVDMFKCRSNSMRIFSKSTGYGVQSVKIGIIVSPAHRGYPWAGCFF